MCVTLVKCCNRSCSDLCPLGYLSAGGRNGPLHWVVSGATVITGDDTKDWLVPRGQYWAVACVRASNLDLVHSG